MLRGYRPIEEDFNFSDVIRNLMDQLLHDRSSDVSQLESQIDEIFTYLDSLGDFFQGQSPPCTETIRAYMVEGLDLYRQCIVELTAYISDRREEHIGRCIALADEAEDLLKSLEIVMAENAAILDLEVTDGV